MRGRGAALRRSSFKAGLRSPFRQGCRQKSPAPALLGRRRRMLSGSSKRWTPDH